MSPEALLLAATTIVRPTAAAAVIAMLSTRRPQHLLVAYVVAGSVFSVAVGTVVVVLLKGSGPGRSPWVGSPLVGTVLGAAALCYAVVVWIGWLPRTGEAPAPAPTWMHRRLQDMSPSGAAAAGVLTHLPGLVYLTSLNAIVGDAGGAADGVAQVLVYNAIWFSVPVVALLLSVHRPAQVREWLARTTSWGRRHRRPITVVFFGALGAYLLLPGAPA